MTHHGTSSGNPIEKNTEKTPENPMNSQEYLWKISPKKHHEKTWKLKKTAPQRKKMEHPNKNTTKKNDKTLEHPLHLPSKRQVGVDQNYQPPKWMGLLLNMIISVGRWYHNFEPLPNNLQRIST